MDLLNPPERLRRTFTRGFIGGIGWALGASVGFALLAIILSWILKGIGGLPLIGVWFADLIEVIQKSLENR